LDKLDKSKIYLLKCKKGQLLRMKWEKWALKF
jgi:hypothetical protein